MSENLRVEISGDAKDLQKATERAEKSLKDFERAAKKSVGGLDKPLNNTSKGFGKLKGSTANATPALLEFNRTIQDAPFGIQGVANNIQQLTANFGFLKQQTGSTRNALKAMLAGLSGPQGILLAVSVVTSLLVTFGNKLGKSASEAEKLAEANKKARESLEKYVDTLRDSDKARIQGQQSAQKELVTLGQLRNVVEDTARSTEDRQKAIQELRRLFPSYFKDLSDEKILTGGLSGVYDELTNSIIKRAKATAATNLLVKSNEKQITLENQLLDTQNKLNQKNQEAILLEQKAISLISKNQSGIELAQSKANKARSEANDLIQEQIRLAGLIGSSQINSLNLGDIINKNGGIDLSKVELKGEPKVVINPDFSIGNNALDTLKDSARLASETLANEVGSISEGINFDFGEEQAKIALNRLANLEIGKKTNLELSLERLNERINNTIASGLSDAFSNLGASLGEALAQGGNVLDALGNSLISSLGGFLSRMGQLLVEYGTLAVLKGKLDLAIVAGGPVAIGAGLAAIAVGVALSAAGAALSSAAQGGAGASGAGSVSSGGSSRTSSFSSSGGGFEGNVVFEIAGTKLIGVLERTRSRNLAIGG